MNEERILDAGQPSLPQKGNFLKWSPWLLRGGSPLGRDELEHTVFFRRISQVCKFILKKINGASI
jgi:hypothetical protein